MALNLGETTDTFILPDASGSPVQVDTGASDATVVLWTCNHCPYALAWHDRIQDVVRDYAPKGAAFFQINANDAGKYPADSIEKMAARVDAGEFASPYLRDEEQSLSKQWGARVTPDVFVFNRNGMLVYRGSPDADHDDPSQNAQFIRRALDETLNGQPVTTPFTKPMGCGVKWVVNDQPNPHVWEDE